MRFRHLLKVMRRKMKKMTDRQKIFDEINRERDYQDKKWGPVTSDSEIFSPTGSHEPLAWITIMKHLIQEAEDEWFKGTYGTAKRKILQTSAVGIAALEQCGLMTR